MLRRIFVGLAAVAVLLVTFTPADAQRRGGGARAGAVGGARGGAVAVRGPRGGGAVAVRGGRGGAVVRGGRGYPYGGGAAAAIGAAAIGAAAAGAYYNNGCGYDPYGNYVCPGRYYPY